MYVIKWLSGSEVVATLRKRGVKDSLVDGFDDLGDDYGGNTVKGIVEAIMRRWGFCL